MMIRIEFKYRKDIQYFNRTVIEMKFKATRGKDLV